MIEESARSAASEHLYGKEDTDYKEEGNPSSGYVFNAAESVLWCRIRDIFTQELRNMYQSVDSNCWSDSHLINEYEAWQNQFPEELWRIHYERLYLRTYRAGTVRFLNEMMNGRGKYHLRQWERDQHIYMGTKFLHTDVKSDQIMFRCNTPKKVVVKPDYTLKIIPYSDMYISVLYGNSPETTQVRAKAGQEYQITTDLTNMDDTAILIYAASRIEALNDLSACYIHDNDFSKASKLKTLTVPVKISSLDDGIYKVKGQCIIGGNNTTVQSSADDVLYLVSHDADTSSTTITKMQGKSITLYFIQQDGEYTTDRYVTESWINEQNFASADSVKEYVSNIIEETVLDVLDEHIDSALDRKLGGIDSEDLTNIFQGGN